MKQYIDLVNHVLENGVYQPNRTGVGTISVFGYFYKANLQDGFPLLTTKKIQTASLIHELFWYLSGAADVVELTKKTRIWDAWSDEDGKLETAYGRFWRRFPVPKEGAPGEKWGDKWTTTDRETGEKVFDQIEFVLDTLKEIKTNPTTRNLRRMVVSAWHPGNAAESKLPPCHYTFCFSVKAGKLNCHLTQRSGDIALGIPFNLACYALLTHMLAKEAGYEVGEFAHTIVDAHIYENHIDGLKKQILREPRPLPVLRLADKPFDALGFEDISFEGYDPHPGIKFEVAV